MSSAPSIVLTDADADDLANGHTINAMDEAGNEHVLGPHNIGKAELDALNKGLAIFVGDHRVEYPD